MPYANKKDADQSAHPRSLISVFVVRCLDSIMPILAIHKIQNFKTLDSLCSRIDWIEFYLVANPEDRFSCDKAYMKGPWVFQCVT